MAAFRFAVRLTPKGGRDAIDGWLTGADGQRVLKVRVKAPPEDGAANDALIRLLARELAIPLKSMRLARGAASRLKQIEIVQADEAVAARLDGLGTAS